MIRVIAETHLATVALCHCVTSGLQMAVKMYHRERLAGKMTKQVPTSKSHQAYPKDCNQVSALGIAPSEQSCCCM